MKRLHTILFVLVFSVMLAVPAAYAADDMVKKLNDVLSKSAAEKFWQVSADDVAAMIKEKKTDFLVVDVRPAIDMYKAGHIPGAIYIPVYDMLKPETLKKLPKNKKIILVCVIGATQNLPVIPLRALGYDARLMSYGMAAWDKKSLGYTKMQEALKGAETKNYPLEK